MSRQFDTTAGADSITFSVGNAPPDQGPITVAVLAKSSSVAGYTGWLIDARKTGTAIWGFLTSNNAGPKLFAENDFGNGVSGLSTSWRWYVMTKASGSVAPRIHVGDLSGTWSHTDNSATVADGSGPVDTIYLGSQNGSSNGWRGSIAVVATWTSVLSDGTIEATLGTSAATVLAASPGWMVRLNQASTATSVTDDTAGGGDQSAISGTSVDADDPPGFDYALTNDVDGTGNLTVTATLAGAASVDHNASGTVTGTATLTGAATVYPGGQGVMSGTATITGAAAVTHNASGVLTAAVGITGAPEPDVATTTSGNWNSLMGVYAYNLAEVERLRTQPIIECPVHRYPLEAGRTPGTRHCKFGGHVMDLHGNPVWI